MEQELFHQMAELEETHWWFQGRRAILNHIISKLPLSPDAEILEAGCGTGGNLAMLAPYGEVHAVELDETSLGYARGRGVGTVLWGRLPDQIPFQGRRFDLIVLLDVLEHLEEDEKTIATLSSLLKEGGWLVLTVPAFQFLYGPHDVIHHHFRRYNNSGLNLLLQGKGLEITLLNYFNTFLFPFVAAVRLARKLVPSRGSDLSGSRFGLFNRFLCALFGAERHLIDLAPMPFGVSLLAVCRKTKP